MFILLCCISYLLICKLIYSTIIPDNVSLQIKISLNHVNLQSNFENNLAEKKIILEYTTKLVVTNCGCISIEILLSSNILKYKLPWSECQCLLFLFLLAIY